jgi:hypothetical protein
MLLIGIAHLFRQLENKGKFMVLQLKVNTILGKIVKSDTFEGMP